MVQFANGVSHTLKMGPYLVREVVGGFVVESSERGRLNAAGYSDLPAAIEAAEKAGAFYAEKLRFTETELDKARKEINELRKLPRNRDLSPGEELDELRELVKDVTTRVGRLERWTHFDPAMADDLDEE